MPPDASRLRALEYRPGQPVTGEDIVMLSGAATPHGMLEHLTSEWVLALRELGRNAWLLRTGGPTGLHDLQALLSAGRPRAFVAFSGVNWDLLANDRLLYEVVNVPYVGLMFDDPAYFPQRHRVASRHLALLFTDDDHHDASRRISPSGAPRGRFRFGTRPPASDPMPWAQRSIDLLFAKTPGDPDRERAAWNDQPPAIRAILNDVADAAVTQEARGLWALVDDRLAQDGLTAGLDATIGMATIVARVDHWVRLERARRVVRALAPHRATIVGEGWRAHLPANARARVVRECDMHELLTLVDAARVTVSVQPNNRFAPHERWLFGMQRGSCVLTDAAPPLRAAIGEEYFWAMDWRDGPDAHVEALMSNLAAAEGRAVRAAPWAREAWGTARGAATVLRAVDTLAGIVAVESPIALPAALSA